MTISMYVSMHCMGYVLLIWSPGRRLRNSTNPHTEMGIVKFLSHNLCKEEEGGGVGRLMQQSKKLTRCNSFFISSELPA